MGLFVIGIAPISIARELWRFGEPGLASEAADMPPVSAAEIGRRAGELHDSGEFEALWPNGPSRYTPSIMLAAIEHLEGRARPCSRSRRLPIKKLPWELQRTEEQLWAASSARSASHGGGTPWHNQIVPRARVTGQLPIL